MAVKKHSTYRLQHQPPELFPIKENPPEDTSYQWQALKDFARSKPDDVLAGEKAANESYNRLMAMIELLKGRARGDSTGPVEIDQVDLWHLTESLQIEIGIIRDSALRTFQVWGKIRREQTKEAN